MVIIENDRIKGSRILCTVYFKDGEIAERTFMNTDENIGLRVHRSRRKYYPLSSMIFNRIDKIVLHNPPKEKTDVQRIIANGKRFLKLLDKRLWPELRSKVEEMLRNVIADHAEYQRLKSENDTQGFTWWFWNKYHEEWIYNRNLFMTINTAFGSWAGKRITKDIEDYLNDKDESFDFCRLADKSGKEKGTYLYGSNRKGYDNAIEVDRKQQKAWMRREFKGCGNGHYYLLISPTHAIHYEDD